MTTMPVDLDRKALCRPRTPARSRSRGQAIWKRAVVDQCGPSVPPISGYPTQVTRYGSRRRSTWAATQSNCGKPRASRTRCTAQNPSVTYGPPSVPPISVRIRGKGHRGGGVLPQAIAAAQIGETLLGGFDIGGIGVVVRVGS